MSQNSTNTPFWRDIRFIRVLLQILFLLGVLLLAGILYTNMQRGLKNLNLELNLDFLSNEAGFYISEGGGYDPSDAYHNAFWVGILNTIKVSLIGIIFATVLGLFFGIARLSSNWLIRNIATAYVEVFRNIPLLLQILFWYTAVIIGQLPLVSNSISLPGSIFINNRGIYLPALETCIGSENLAHFYLFWHSHWSRSFYTAVAENYSSWTVPVFQQNGHYLFSLLSQSVDGFSHREVLLN